MAQKITDPYARIMSVLDTPKTMMEIGSAIRATNSGHMLMVRKLWELGLISRIRLDNTRLYYYQRERETISKQEVAQMVKDRKAGEHVPATNGRIISFDTQEMKAKLKASNKLNRRKTGKIYVSANWQFD